ncbi:MAG: Glucose-1-phosphate thymidylyltransferase [candidate division WS2 bacterium]|nr:MAG: glucose-1-phosphate thymidylyltransferase [Methanosarcinales archaeon Met12]MBT9150410.1 Glucose-1-phosphate thymidylyltransferase [Candidatus Psychracetigena formicireducens]
MKGLILSGGHGTKLRPITYSQQKQLIPVANKPILFYAIEDVIEAGIKDVGIIVGPNRKDVMEAVNNAYFDAEISFIEQEAPLGIAHAVKISEDFIGDEPFVVYLGDNILKGGIMKYVKRFKEGDMDASILLTTHENPSLFGCAELNEDGSIKRLIEKPKKPPSNLILVGIYVFRPSIFKAVKNIKPSWRNELEITDAIQYLIDNNLKVDSDIVSGWWKDTGRPEDILEANHLVLDELKPYNEGILEDGAKISGRVAIEEGTIIKKSVIKGPVVIGANCMIGPNTYIGPYTSIGNSCEIINGEIESSIVMSGTKINCNKKIIDSIIGKNVKICDKEKMPKGYRFIIGDSSQVEL